MCNRPLTNAGHAGQVQGVSIKAVAGVALLNPDAPPVLTAVQYPTLLCLQTFKWPVWICSTERQQCESFWTQQVTILRHFHGYHQASNVLSVWCFYHTLIQVHWSSTQFTWISLSHDLSPLGATRKLRTTITGLGSGPADPWPIIHFNSNRFVLLSQDGSKALWYENLSQCWSSYLWYNTHNEKLCSSQCSLLHF